MIIFLYGSDGYRLKQNSQTVLSNYLKKHPSGVNLFKFDLSDGQMDKFEDTVKSSSFFDEVKLIVLKNVFSKKLDSAKVAGVVENYNLAKEKSVALLLLENLSEKELASKDKNLFNLLVKKDNLVKVFNFFDGEKLNNWIKSEFILRGCSIEPRAVGELVAIVGNESWALVNEIEKLCNFKTGRVIDKEDINLLCFRKTENNIFDFVDALGNKNRAKAYDFLYKEIKSGRDPYYLLTMMIYGFRNLLAVKDLVSRNMSANEIAKKAKIHPFVARKTSQSSGAFKIEELKDIYGRLLDMDTHSKEGKINLTDALFSFVIGF